MHTFGLGPVSRYCENGLTLGCWKEGMKLKSRRSTKVPAIPLGYITSLEFELHVEPHLVTQTLLRYLRYLAASGYEQSQYDTSVC
jgi:hypothetical protein